MFLIPQSWYSIKKLKNRGRGAFANREIPPGTIIGDYLGTIIKSGSNDENRKGLYDMAGGKKYDILAHPKENGIHLINHSCANNCDAYPYRGHILYVALRKIFKGEEFTVNYSLESPDPKDVPCRLHLCYCGSQFCTGSMHGNKADFEKWFKNWDKLVKKNFGQFYRKIPGKYGDELKPYPNYPDAIKIDNPNIYPNLFGSEYQPAAIFKNTNLPQITELRKYIRETGRRLAFPKLHLIIYGICDGMIIAERK